MLAVLNHLFQFFLPALWLGAGVALLTPIFIRNRPLAKSLPWQLAINCVVDCLVQALGLWFFAVDGKMATYAALVLACASSQWVGMRARRKTGG